VIGFCYVPLTINWKPFNPFVDMMLIFFGKNTKNPHVIWTKMHNTVIIVRLLAIFCFPLYALCFLKVKHMSLISTSICRLYFVYFHCFKDYRYVQCNNFSSFSVNFEVYQREILHFGTYPCVRNINLRFGVLEVNMKSTCLSGM
jgi:hypothetical protein